MQNNNVNASVKKVFNCLLIDNNQYDINLLSSLLKGTNTNYYLTIISEIGSIDFQLNSVNFDLIILDLDILSSCDISIFLPVLNNKINVPVLIISSFEKESLAIEALTYGAKDYIVKDHISKETLIRVINCAILRKSIEKECNLFKSFADSAGYGFSLLDVEGKIIYLNDSFCKILKLSSQETVLGKTFDAFCSKLQKRSVCYDILPKIKEKSQWKGYIDLTQSDGNTITTLQNLIAIKDIEDEIICYGNLTIDVSLQLAMESKLKEAELKYRTVSDFTYWMECWHDLDKSVKYISPSCERITGYSAKEFMDNKNLFFEIVHPDDKQKYLESSNRCSDSSCSEVLEYRIVRKDGECIWVQKYNRAVSDTEGNFLGCRSSTIEITKRKVAESLLNKEKEFAQNLINTAQVVILLLDTEGHIVLVNPYFEEISGYSMGEILFKNWVDTFIPEYLRNNINGIFKKSISDMNTKGYINPIVAKDQSLRYIEWYDKTLKDNDGNVVGLLAVGQDVTQKLKTEEKNRNLSAVVEQSPVSVIITDDKGNIEYVNKKFVELTGYKLDEVIGKNPRILKSGNTSDYLYKHLWETISNGNEWRGEFCNKKKDGSLYWEHAIINPIKNVDGVITNYLGIKEDLTVRKEYEQKLEEVYNYDSLTKLPNRILALDRINQEITRNRRTHCPFAVFYIDLDNFKKINDTLGHVVGDNVIIEFSERLKSTVRESDTVARLSGDDFLLILSDFESVPYIATVAQKILETLKKPFHVEDNELYITTSIGITISPDDGDNAQMLVRNSESAMYQAKEDLRNTFRFFKSSINEEALLRIKTESNLHHALEKRQLILHYQPLIEAQSGKIVGAEALLRWHDDEKGLLFPNSFIELAEESGLIVPIGAWIINTACLQAKIWQDTFGSFRRICVNVSYRQLREKNFVDIVSAALTNTGLHPGCLELEITERLIMDDNDNTFDVIERLRNMGVRLSVDDFGSGFSSINYLRKFNFDTLKIDRDFIKNVPGNYGDLTLITAIISMAKGLGLMIIGEGVETPDQLKFLRNYECDWIQGFYYSRPLDVKSFEAYIQENSINL